LQLIEQIQKKLTEESKSVLKMSNETGISAYKIYKWLDQKGKPKHEDAKKLEEWLSNNMDKVPTQTAAFGAGTPASTPTNPLERILHEKELLIQEKEARRQEAADRARRAEEQNDRLLDIIKENLNLLQTNSTKSLVYAETLLRVVQADDFVMMGNQDEQLKHKKGSSSAKAGKLELSIAQEQQRTGTDADAHK
jgi:hypothetical protein